MEPSAPQKKPTPPSSSFTRLRLGALDCATQFSWIVALSGGRDSVALLHTLNALARESQRSVRAVHVHHGLSENADAWAEFCADLCSQWRIPLEIVRVQVQTGVRLSVEAQARKARYQALANECDPASVVALAHHADDQIETFFIQLLRGAGPRGLAAMPEFSVASHTRPALWRPWLLVTRAQIDGYVAQHQLPHIEDESNHNTRFKRNALREDLLPVLEKHVPHYRAGVLRSISLQQDTLNALAPLTKPTAQNGPLFLNLLREVSFTQAVERLRAWLVANTLPLPPAARTREAVNQLRGLSSDQRFVLQLADGWELRVSSDSLIALRTNA